MKRFRLILALVLTLGLLFLLASKYKKLPTLGRQPKIDIYANFELTGILRELDLNEEMKAALLLKEGRFQLTRLNVEDAKKLPYEAANLFLENYPTKPADLIGKCVTVKGKLDTDWISKIFTNSKEDKFSYSGLAFKASGLEKVDYSKCSGYSERKREDEETAGEIPAEAKPITVSGVVQRLARPVPDVGPYDYIFIFTEPYTSEINSSGLPQKMDYMPIAPQNNDTWVKLENKVGKKTAVEAYELWGYVESKYLLITRVME